MDYIKAEGEGLLSMNCTFLALIAGSCAYYFKEHL